MACYTANRDCKAFLNELIAFFECLQASGLALVDDLAEEENYSKSLCLIWPNSICLNVIWPNVV